jgi:GWxTD domain-containing protein
MVLFRLVIVLIFFSFSFNRCIALDASIDVYRFRSNATPYIDVYLRLLSNSIAYHENKNGKYSAAVDVLMLIKRGNDIVTAEKFRLNAENLVERKDLLDRKRFALNPDLYSVEVKMTDLNDTLNKFHASKLFKIEQPTSHTNFSDIQLLTDVKQSQEDVFGKNGLYLEPMPYGLLTESRPVLSFYTELYLNHADSSKYCIVGYTIFPFGDSLSQSNSIVTKYKKVKEQSTIPLVFTNDLNKLVSGDYILKVMLVDQHKKEIISQTQAFVCDNIPADLAHERNYNKMVNNSFVANLDSARLQYIMYAMVPIISTQLQNTHEQILKGNNIEAKKYFILKYWTNKYPLVPEQSFNQYMKIAELIDREFNSNFGKGFQTDRGYVFLKYGKPNKVIDVDDEPNTPPYEIWYYDFMAATGQNDVRFLFFNPSLAPNDFQLLHSNCYGSRNNPNWEFTLYKNSRQDIQGNGIDASKIQDNWQRRAKKLFDEI